jgi:hypothetical protein
VKAKLKDTAKILGLTEYFLRTEAKAGRIPFYAVGGGWGFFGQSFHFAVSFDFFL